MAAAAAARQGEQALDGVKGLCLFTSLIVVMSYAGRELYSNERYIIYRYTYIAVYMRVWVTDYFKILKLFLLE